MKYGKKLSHVVIAALAASVLGVVGDTSMASAEPAPVPLPTVLGYDSEGNPVYLTDGKDIADPEEDPTGLANVMPFEDVDEYTEQPDRATGETCKPSATGTIKNVKNALKVDWPDSAINDFPTKGKFTVKAETSKKFTWGVSASVTAEGSAWIFAKVSATINGNIAHEKTTTYGSTYEVEVPPRTTVKVDRGMWQEKFTYKIRMIGKTCLIKNASGSGQAPYRQAWHVYK